MEGGPRLNVTSYVIYLSVIHEIQPTPLPEPVTGTYLHLENITQNMVPYPYGQGKIFPFNMPRIN
jgi:hypothetical protein